MIKIQAFLANLFFKKDLQNKFTKIYRENIFGGKHSKSGEGSDLIQTEVIRKSLPGIIKKYEITSILDAPCGDWYWMQKIDLAGIKYDGVDIVEDLIIKNNEIFSTKEINFYVKNIAADSLPISDLILCRDCLVHLSFSDSIKIIQNFKNSGSKYLLTTSFSDRSQNIDLGRTFWRPLNMTLPPFNFPPPIELINENCTEGNNLYNDKSLALWKLDSL